MYQYFPKARNADLVVQETDAEILVYDLTNNEAFCLNETSALIWRECDGTKSVSEISSTVSRKTGAAVTDDFVSLGILGLAEKHLLQDTDVPSQLTGMSRRDMVKKVGLGTMIALPVIASLVAPVSAQTASCGGACNNPSDCPNQVCNRCTNNVCVA